MSQPCPVARPVVLLAVIASIVTACTGVDASVPPASVEPSATSVSASALPTPVARATAFPTEAFAAFRDDPVPEEVAAKFQAALAGLANGAGMAAAVITPEGSWSGAAGTADGVHDLQPDSQFGIASGTKPIVAAQLMRLVEAGEVELDAPATDYLPADFPFDTNGATIRQLLSHRSGIPDYYTEEWAARMEEERARVWEVEEVLAMVDEERRPLGSFAYANVSYALLGLIIEHVRQRPLAEVLRDDVLRVEGTERLVYQPDEAPTEPMAMPLGESRDALEQGGGYLPSIALVSSDAPAAGMASDAISLARWWQALCAGEIVSEGSLNEMATFYDDVEIDYGLGLLNPAEGYAEAVGHMGASFGYESWSACLTEDPMVVVVLHNKSGAIGVPSIWDLGRPLMTAARSD